MGGWMSPRSGRRERRPRSSRHHGCRFHRDKGGRKRPPFSRLIAPGAIRHDKGGRVALPGDRRVSHCRNQPGAERTEKPMQTITRYLAEKQAHFMVAPHPNTYSSLAEAKELGVAPDEVIKTVMLSTTTGHVAAVIPASSRVDTRRLEDLLHVEDARLATEEEITEDFPDFELGALPPVPSLLGIPLVVDPKV